MGLLVPELHRKLASLQEGEDIIGINARAGDEHDFDRLAFAILEAETDSNPEDMLTVDMSSIEVLRCGWIEEPPPDKVEGIHDAPLGKLWVVYKKPEIKKETALDRHNRQFEEEKQRTGVCRADVIQFLVHDTSSTRLQLAQVLRQRAELIEAEAQTDHALNRLVGHNPEPKRPAGLVRMPGESDESWHFRILERH